MPQTIIHPGEILLEEFLKPYGMTPTAFATRLGLPPNRITQIVNGERGITPETAILFAATFGTSEAFWMNLQNHYALQTAQAQVSPERVALAHALHDELESA